MRQCAMEALYKKINCSRATLSVSVYVIFVSLSLYLVVSLSLSVSLCISDLNVGGGFGGIVLPPGGQLIAHTKFTEY